LLYFIVLFIFYIISIDFVILNSTLSILIRGAAFYNEIN